MYVEIFYGTKARHNRTGKELKNISPGGISNFSHCTYGQKIEKEKNISLTGRKKIGLGSPTYDVGKKERRPDKLGVYARFNIYYFLSLL